MKNPTKKFIGKTWVGWLNIILLQWLFVRLSYGDKWRLLTGIIPMTGWNTSYRYVFRKTK